MPRLSPRTDSIVNVSPPPLQQMEIFQLRGLNLSVPDEIMPLGNAVKAQNIRLFAREEEAARVSVSTRKGSTIETTPLGQASTDSESSTTGATDGLIRKIKWRGQKFTAGSNGRLSQVQLRLKTNDGNGPIIVKIYSDNSGSPGTLLATSSIRKSVLTGSYAYASADFIEAPEVTASTDYWIVAYIQTNGSGSYHWSTTTNSTDAIVSSNSGATWTTTTYSFNFDAYISTDEPIIGLARYYKSGATPETIFAVDQNVYKYTTGSPTSIQGSLSASATDYFFEQTDDKLWWCNGYDAPKVYDGTTVADVGGTPGTGRLVARHVNRLWWVVGETKLVYSEIADYENYPATNFIEVPAPDTGDPIKAIEPFQGNLLIATRKTKYILYGSDNDDFVLRHVPGAEGVVNGKSLKVLGSLAYSVSDDSVNVFDGSKDVPISQAVEPIVNSITNNTSTELQIFQNTVRMYYKIQSETKNSHCLIFDRDLQEWVEDTDVYVSRSLVHYDDIADPDSTVKLMEASSLIGALYFAEQEDSQGGKPIYARYWTKYHHLNAPVSKKRVKRLYPIMRAQNESFNFTIKFDTDHKNKPTLLNPIAMQGEGATWGDFAWADGTKWGSTVRIEERLSVPGNATSFQFRFEHEGVDTPIELIGYVMYYRTKKPR